MILALILSVLASERTIAVTALPAPIQAAIPSGYPGATIVEASVETEDGVSVYEAEIHLGSRQVTLSYTADGVLQEEEEVVALSSTPAPVQAKIAGYAGWTVRRVDRAVAKGVTTFEVLLVKEKQRKEVVMDEAGIESPVHD